jgi:hypothetical protein
VLFRGGAVRAACVGQCLLRSVTRWLDGQRHSAFAGAPPPNEAHTARARARVVAGGRDSGSFFVGEAPSEALMISMASRTQSSFPPFLTEPSVEKLSIATTGSLPSSSIRLKQMLIIM